ncbi:MAG: class I SAM-dependent DNA methyltransferase [Eubacteriales bacterium]
MARYGGLAAIYDRLVSGVDFEGWIDYLEEILTKYKYVPRTVLDLACGTGNTVLPLARRGYRACGVDLSPEMVAVAESKALSGGLDVNFFVGDMREFISPRPVDLVICFHDGLNYLVEYADLVRTFKHVNENLVPGGVFVFDLNAVIWLSGTDAGTTVLEEEDFTIIWDSAYLDGDGVWEVRLTCFAREGELYRKFYEFHREKAYPPEVVSSALQEAGLTKLGCYNAFTFEPPSAKSLRHFFVAKKPDL